MPKLKSETKSKVKNESVGAVKLSHEQQVRREILEITERQDHEYLRLAELLAEAYHNKYYTNWGFVDFETFSNTELNTEYRKAMMLVNIWDKVSDLGIEPDQLANLGWTKLRNLIKILNKDNKDTLLKEAENLTVREIDEKVSIAKKTDTSAANLPSTTTLKIIMGEDVGAIILDAINASKEMLSTESTSQALSVICQDWMMAHGSIPDKASVSTIISYVKAAYDVDLVISGGAKTKAKKVEEPVVQTSEVDRFPDASIDDLLSETAPIESEPVVPADPKLGKKGKAKKAAEPVVEPEPEVVAAPEKTKAKAKGKAKGKAKAEPVKEETVIESTTDDNDIDSLLGL
jgi:hypothetical protein